MLKQAIEKCPEALWNHPDDKTKFWQIAYHALFYVHLYLQKNLDDFRPWGKHKEKAESLGPRDGQAEPLQLYSPVDVLEYLALCQQEIDEKTAQLEPEAESGFYWLPMSKLELQFYNIRHLQQHTGEVMERLGTRAGVEVDWVGIKRD
jgi:hypothetical protein